MFRKVITAIDEFDRNVLMKDIHLNINWYELVILLCIVALVFEFLCMAIGAIKSRRKEKDRV